MKRDRERMLRGEEPLQDSVNTVKDVPEEFRQWVEDNAERIDKARSKPYFLSDNEELIRRLTTPQEEKEFEATIEDCKKFLVSATDKSGMRSSKNFKSDFDAAYATLAAPTEEAWKGASMEVRQSLVDYTSTAYEYINAVMRGSADAFLKDEYGKDAKNLEEFISLCKSPKAFALNRGTSSEEIQSVFGNDVLQKIWKKDKSVIGAKGIQKGFMSTSFEDVGAAYFRKDFELCIYCPKGTEMAAAFPVSNLGWAEGVKWNGKRPKGMYCHPSDENEMIINAGYELKIIGFEQITSSGRYRLFLQLLDRK